MGFFDKPVLQLATEYPPPDEQQHIDGLIETLGTKMRGDYAKKRMLRDAHPKMHGCVRGEFTIEPNLPDDLRIGLFEQGRTFPAWVRFSNQNNAPAPDSKPDIRGAAIKLMGVMGQKLMQDAPDETTHDFIVISDSRFVTKDVAQFDGLVKALVSGIFAIGWFFVTHLRAARNLMSSLQRHANPLSIRYFSVVPYRLGQRAVKYSLTPRDCVQTPIPKDGSENYLREAMVNQLDKQDAVFDFAIQFQTDPYSMPIEDPGITWDEAVSPFRKVATLRIPPQVFDTAEQREFGDNLSFNPWRCLPPHRPLGGISRARLQVYQALSKLRHEANQAPRVEPVFDGGPPRANAKLTP